MTEIPDMQLLLERQIAELSHFRIGLVISQFRKRPMILTTIYSLTSKLKALEKSKHRLPEKFYRQERIKLTTLRTKLLNQILKTRYVTMMKNPLFSLAG